MRAIDRLRRSAHSFCALDHIDRRRVDPEHLSVGADLADGDPMSDPFRFLSGLLLSRNHFGKANKKESATLDWPGIHINHEPPYIVLRMALSITNGIPGINKNK